MHRKKSFVSSVQILNQMNSPAFAAGFFNSENPEKGLAYNVFDLYTYMVSTRNLIHITGSLMRHAYPLSVFCGQRE